MSFCIWGPVTEMLFQATEYVFPLNSLHPQKDQEQASNKCGQTLIASPTHGDSAQHWGLALTKCKSFLLNTVSILEALWRLSMSFPWAEWTHHLRELSSQYHGGIWAPYAKGLAILHQVQLRSSLGWCYQPKFVSYDTCHAHRIIETTQLEKTFKIIRSNH